MDQTEIKFIQQVQQQHLFQANDRVLVAVSGGSDSMALLALLLHLPTTLGIRIAVATVDFDLRAQSANEVKMVQHFCQQHQLPFYTTIWQHPAPITGMELQARKFRYKFFAQIMQQQHLNKLVTAHQGDDQIETILMKLIRSGSIWESTGIAVRRPFQVGEIIRPLLAFSKTELINYLQRQQIDFAVDETNFTDITLRNRLRNQVIPLLKSENPRLQQHWTVFAQQNQVLQQITQNYFQQLSQQAVIVSAKTVKINLSSLTHLSSQAVVLFVQSVLHRHLELDLQARQLEQLEQLLNRAQGQLTLAHKWILEKSYQLLIIQQFDHSLQKVSAINLKLNQTVFANQQQKITIKQSVRENNHTFYFEHLPRQIIVRPRRPGDRIRLLNGQHQKLKQRLIDLKIPQKQRNQLWLVVFDGEIVWVPGVYRYQIYPTPYLFEIIIGEQK